MKGRASGGGGGGGGCCFARYNNSDLHYAAPSYYNNNNNVNTTTTYPSYYTSNNVSDVDRIMLRFRPIAPKPTISGPNSTSSSSGGSNNANAILKPNVVRKRKRKANTTNTSTCKIKNSRSLDYHNVSIPCNPVGNCYDMVTLPLLPQTPDLSPNKVGPTFLCFGSPEVVQSSVTVQGVSDTWQDGNGLGRTDEERKRMLDEDTCPGFISDGWNRVWWTNEEYRKMVAGENGNTWRKEKLVSVKLEMRENVELPKGELYAAFTCRVRVQYGNGTHTMTVPCDVWRMNGGGFAWRLDVQAALCLGL